MAHRIWDAPHNAELYDRRYAREYDRRFLEVEWSRPALDGQLALLAEILDRGGRWLDVGCGTGFVLSRFPHVDRAGLDLSSAMLELASRRNPGILLRHGDYRDIHEDWQGGWDVVTLMWAAYCYVDDLAQFDGLIANLAAWTAPDGALLLPVIDVDDLFGRTVLPFEQPQPEVSGSVEVPAVIWSWYDDVSGKEHPRVLAPHAEHIRRTLATHFEVSDLVWFPTLDPAFRRKAVLAAGPRGRGGKRTDRVRSLIESNHAAMATAGSPPSPSDEPSLAQRLWHVVPRSLRARIGAGQRLRRGELRGRR